MNFYLQRNDDFAIVRNDCQHFLHRQLVTSEIQLITRGSLKSIKQLSACLTQFKYLLSWINLFFSLFCPKGPDFREQMWWLVICQKISCGFPQEWIKLHLQVRWCQYNLSRITNQLASCSLINSCHQEGWALQYNRSAIYLKLSDISIFCFLFKQ